MNAILTKQPLTCDLSSHDLMANNQELCPSFHCKRKVRRPSDRGYEIFSLLMHTHLWSTSHWVPILLTGLMTYDGGFDLHPCDTLLVICRCRWKQWRTSEFFMKLEVKCTNFTFWRDIYCVSCTLWIHHDFSKYYNNIWIK